jgi:hypothetical protein
MEVAYQMDNTKGNKWEGLRDTPNGKRLNIDILTSKDGSEQIIALLGLSHFKDDIETDLVLTLTIGVSEAHATDMQDVVTSALTALRELFNYRKSEVGYLDLMKLSTYISKAGGYDCQESYTSIDVRTLIKVQKENALYFLRDSCGGNIERFKKGKSSLGDIMSRLEIDLKGCREGKEMVEVMWLESMTNGLVGGDFECIQGI